MNIISKLAISLVVLISQFIVVYSATAQSMPVFNDPIKVRQIEVMASDLELTAIQTQAFLELYDVYLEDFARVRGGEVQDFEDEVTSLADTFNFMSFNIPERAVLESMIARGLRAMKSIQRVDSLFFDEVSGILTENQQKLLKRERNKRELSAYEIFVLAMLGEINEGSGVNLRTILAQQDIEESVEMQEILDTYDAKYLRASKEALDSVVEMLNTVLDIIDELGVRGMDQQAMMMMFMDPERIEGLKARADVLMQPVQAMAYDMSQLNWRTWQQLDDLLSEDDAHKLRKQYFSKAFWQSVKGESRVDKYFDRALGFPELNDGQRQQLEEAQATFNGRWKSRAQKHAKVLDQSRKSRTINVLTGEQAGAHTEALDLHEEQRDELVESTISKIDGILGAEVLAKLNEKKNQQAKSKGNWSSKGSWESKGGNGKDADVEVVYFDSPNGEEIVMKDGILYVDGVEVDMEELPDDPIFVNGAALVSSGNGQTITVQSSVSTDSGVETNVEYEADSMVMPWQVSNVSMPTPLSPTFPKQAPQILGLDESGDALISALYDEYRENYDSRLEELQTEGKAIDSNDDLDAPKKHRASQSASELAAEYVKELDLAFFDDLTTMTGLDRDHEDLVMLEDFRTRQRDSITGAFFDMDEMGNTVDLVDLYLLSNSSKQALAEVSDEARNTINFALRSYHNQVGAPYAEFVDAQRSLKRMESAMMFMDYDDPNISQRIQEKWMETFTAIRDAGRAYNLANQLFMDSILKNIPESDFWNVRYEFVNNAYPDVFRNAKDATSMLNIAMAIQGLDAGTQSQLKQFADEYRHKYWDLCEQMIQLHQSDASAKTSQDSFVSQADLQREIQKETFKFERNELFDRAQMMMRLLLNEDQIKQVPGLKPSAESPRKW